MVLKKNGTKGQLHKRFFLLVGILMLMVFVTVGCTGVKGTDGDVKPEPAKPPKQEAKKDDATPVSTGAKNQVAKNQCSECHEMWPQVTTWQVSAHAKISCTTCHQVKADDFRAASQRGFQKPITIRNKPVSNDVCIGCHAMENREATPIWDIIIPHDQHDKANVPCLDCHRSVVHGDIADRKVTLRDEFSKFDQWSPELAKKAVPSYFRRPSMWVCTECHHERSVTTKCSVCHYAPERSSLPSHEPPSFIVEHGKIGRNDVGFCTKCHASKDGPMFVTPSTGDQIADFARANSFCYKCHLKRPANHDTGWMPKHSSTANSRGIANCFACHDKDQPGANVTGTYCNSCHWFKTAAPAPEVKEQ